VGAAVILSAEGSLFIGPAVGLEGALAAGRIVFHHGRIGGALPQVRGAS
jgi:hypothetical protein